MVDRIEVGDRGALEYNNNHFDHAEVIKTPSGEGDVWGFRNPYTGTKIFTNERFTFYTKESP